MNEQNNQHHYFATTAFYWVVGATRQEAIENMARRFSPEELKHQKKASGGIYTWTCRVALPQNAHYAIENYMPKVNPNEITEVRTFNIVNRDGSVKVTD